MPASSRIRVLGQQLAPRPVAAATMDTKPDLPLAANSLRSRLTITRLHPALGAQVEGLDLRSPLSPEEVREMNEIWAEANGILVFRGHGLLNKKELSQFSGQFGHPLRYPFESPATKAKMDLLENPEVTTIKGVADNWHTDMTWMRYPPKATFLQCVRRDESMDEGGAMGSSRGDTMFASMTNAYDNLSPGLQKMLEGMTCRHAVHELREGITGISDDQQEFPNGCGEMSALENEHPAIIVHPVTGKKSMYVNNWPCKRFTGMSQEETAPLKKYLNSVATRENNVYRHSWQVGDLVMIDQRCTMHYVWNDFDPAHQTRIMQRTTIVDLGDAPGVYNQPRPLGVTGKNGVEMSSGPDVNVPPVKKAKDNITKVQAPFSDVPGLEMYYEKTTMT